MRTIGQKLGVEAMSLYNHVANKDDIVDGMVDLAFSEIDLPAAETDWKTAMRDRAIAVREAPSRHRWAIGPMESRRNPDSATLRHVDAVIGSLRAAGFDMATAAHIYSLLDSYIYGFAMTQMNLPFENTAEVAEVAQSMLQAFPINEFPTWPRSSPSTR
ncbi:MAG: TetR/AcrR family transcriptional regulator C-terminal domain-containing protein [Chloroflexota bacterium]|nr:TetR/AcrR family transcriptional regulator C-terminal domain-containing protein [Chloroflexota bacterium]